VITESYSKLVVDQIHSNEKDISECGMIFNQIKDIMRSSPSIIVRYSSRRECSLVSHSYWCKKKKNYIVTLYIDRVLFHLRSFNSLMSRPEDLQDIKY